MQKLKLDLSALAVEGFDTTSHGDAQRGTVPAHAMNSEMNCLPSDGGCGVGGSEGCGSEGCGTAATDCGTCYQASCGVTNCGTCATNCGTCDPYCCCTCSCC